MSISFSHSTAKQARDQFCIYEAAFPSFFPSVSTNSTRKTSHWYLLKRPSIPSNDRDYFASALHTAMRHCPKGRLRTSLFPSTLLNCTGATTGDRPNQQNLLGLLLATNRCFLRPPFAAEFRIPWQMVRLSSLTIAFHVSHPIVDDFLLKRPAVAITQKNASSRSQSTTRRCSIHAAPRGGVTTANGWTPSIADPTFECRRLRTRLAPEISSWAKTSTTLGCRASVRRIGLSSRTNILRRRPV